MRHSRHLFYTSDYSPLGFLNISCYIFYTFSPFLLTLKTYLQTLSSSPSVPLIRSPPKNVPISSIVTCRLFPQSSHALTYSIVWLHIAFCQGDLSCCYFNILCLESYIIVA